MILEKETALFNENAIDSGIEEAGTKATNYLSADSTGIMVEAMNGSIETPSTATGQNVFISNTAVNVRDGQTVLARFGADGAQVGQSGTAHSVIDANGQRFYASDGTTLLANIGYGEGNTQSGTLADAPYYTMGKRIGTIGNYSMAEGTDTTASGYASHAENAQTYATGYASHAEGSLSTASGNTAHAEGSASTASADASHAEGVSTASADYAHSEGYGTIASGAGSHAQNFYTTAGYDAQTAIGKYNDNQSTSAFEIGNGSSGGSPHNAFTVDWEGNVNMQGSLTLNGSEMKDYVIAEGQASNWLYRKWKSGKIEAWLQDTTITISKTTAVGNVYRCSWNHAIASGVGFSSAPQVFLTVGQDAQYVFGVNGKASSATAISGYAFRANASSNTSTVTINIYAVGY